MRIYLDKRKLSKSPTPTEHQHYRRFMILYLFIVLDHQYMVAKKSFENTLLNTKQLIFKIRHKNINYAIDVDPLDIQTIFVT